MLRKLALISAVSALAMGTALAQSPNPPTSSDTPSMSQQDKSPSMSQDKPSTTTTQSTGSMQSSGMKSADFIASQKPDQFLASKFKGTDVLGSDNQKIGDVSDILFDKTGKIDAYVVSVGGFLGIGSKEVALAPSAFQVVPADPNSATDRSPKLKTSMTKDQLKEAANFEPFKEPRATTGAGGAGAPRPSGSSGGMNR